MQHFHDLVRECGAWSLALAAHGFLALALLQPATPAREEEATPFLAVALAALQPQEAPAEPTPVEEAEPEAAPEPEPEAAAPPPALDLAPPAAAEAPAAGDAWDVGAAGPGPAEGPERPAPVEISEDAVRALPLELEVGDPGQFVAAARALGLRFLVYPAEAAPSWLVELSGPDLAAARRLARLPAGSLSRRAHDLTPDPWFRARRDAALRRLGLPAGGTRIVAAVPGGTDRIFLAAERRFLEERGLAPEEAGTLRGRLRRRGGAWELVIVGAGGLE